MTADTPLTLSAALKSIKQCSNRKLAYWIRQSLINRTPSDVLVESLTKSGYDPASAKLLVGLVAQGFCLSDIGEKGDIEPVDYWEQGQPLPPHTFDHTRKLSDGTKVDILLTQGRDNLEVCLYSGVIHEDEMDYIKKLTQPQLHRSQVTGKDFSAYTDDIRTSREARPKSAGDKVLMTLDKRIAELVGHSLANSEDFQVLHYGVTNEFKPHYDFFFPATEKERALMQEQGGNRIGTLLVYLDDTKSGGSTYFPKLDIAVHPHKGQAVWFGYKQGPEKFNTKSFHAGLPVISGQKWVLTKWFRENESCYYKGVATA